ncbi:M48 family metallopeptidase [bacterium]|nr:M48 family metallopeptidase [bacterium]
MKKILSILFLVFTFISVQYSAFADTKTGTSSTNWDSKASLERVNRIGNVLLTKNNLPQGITFTVSDEDDVNAYADINKEVHVYRGLLNYVDYDHELAGVISHEMGHIINGHCAKQTLLNAAINSVTTNIANNTKTTAGNIAVAAGNQLATSKISRNDEFEADLTGVDLMVKAGYNPLAMISVLNKITGNYIDVLETHPSGEKRLMNIYNYVSYNYPQYTKEVYNTDSYKKALTMINANIEQRNASKKLQKKYEKEQKKLLKKREKRAKKMQNSLNAWDASFATLYYMSGSGSDSSK